MPAAHSSAASPDTPRVLACDAEDGIVVIAHAGNEQALVRGQIDGSGDWRVTQVTADSAMFVAVHESGSSIRVFLESSGRSPLKFSDRPPTAPPAVALDIQRLKATTGQPEEQ